MTQVKVYGLAEHLNSTKADLSRIIHSCVVEAFAYPVEKRFHRFFPLSMEGSSTTWTGDLLATPSSRSVRSKAAR
jgi:hypothetical protein